MTSLRSACPTWRPPTSSCWTRTPSWGWESRRPSQGHLWRGYQIKITTFSWQHFVTFISLGSFGSSSTTAHGRVQYASVGLLHLLKMDLDLLEWRKYGQHVAQAIRKKCKWKHGGIADDQLLYISINFIPFPSFCCQHPARKCWLLLLLYDVSIRSCGIWKKFNTYFWYSIF